VSNWTRVEVYATFLKLSGEIEVVRPDRLTDSVNRFGQYIQLRNTRAEPLSVNYPVISRLEPRTTIAKSAVILLCPLEESSEGNSAMWREKVAQPAAINTSAFSLVGDVHLDQRHSLQDHMERYPGDFLPITNLSALWVTAISSETHAVQRPFALLNPATILSFSHR
jgi:hypothetical protein